MARSTIGTTLALTCLSWAAFAQVASAASQTLGFTGTEQTFTVPAGVSSLHLVAVGAKGGKGSDAASNIGGSGCFGDRLEA